MGERRGHWCAHTCSMMLPRCGAVPNLRWFGLCDGVKERDGGAQIYSPLKN